MLPTLLTLQSENHSNLNPKPKITMVDIKTIYLVCNLSFKGTTTKKHFATNEVCTENQQNEIQFSKDHCEKVAIDYKPHSHKLARWKFLNVKMLCLLFRQW